MLKAVKEISLSPSSNLLCTYKFENRYSSLVKNQAVYYLTEIKNLISRNLLVYLYSTHFPLKSCGGLLYETESHILAGLGQLDSLK